MTGEIVYPTDEYGERRIFVSAKIDDNPHLDPETYRRSLMALDPVTRAQLLHGDWDARPPGEFFDRSWFVVVWRPEEQEALRAAATHWCRFWDLASSERQGGSDPDWTAGVLMGRTADDIIVVADVIRLRAKPADVEATIVEVARRDANILGCRTVRIEQEPGSSGAFAIEGFAKKLLGFDFQGVRTTGPKAERARPFASYARSGLVRVLAGPWTAEYLAELEAFPSPGVHDDQVDASSGAFEQLASAYYPGAATIEPERPRRLLIL
jgi:predicted phage terminase large subunit-like protein